MKQLHDILRRPLITEKSTLAKEMANQIVFEVAPWANKIEIRRAIEIIGELMGEITPDDILNKIFSEFCVGK